MLRLESIAALEAALKKLPAIGTNLAPGAAHTYVRATQLEQTLCLESVGVEAIHTSIEIKSVNTVEGCCYLFPLADLKETLDRLESSYAFQTHAWGGMLNIDTYTEFVDNEPLILDTATLQTFGGSLDEFKVPIAGSPILTAESESSNTANLLSRVCSYGDYSNRSGGDRGVLLQFNFDTLTIYSIPQSSPNFYLQQAIPLTKSSNIDCHQVVVLGCHLASLNNLINDKEEKTITWSTDGQYLTLVCGANKVNMPLQDIDRFAYLKPLLTSFEPSSFGDLQASYTLLLNRSIAAIKAQQPSKATARFLTFTDTGTSIKLGKTGDILNREWSLLEFLDRQVNYELPRLTIAAVGLLKSIQALEAYAKKSGIDCDLSLEVYSKTVGERQRWVVKLSLQSTFYQNYLPVVLGSVNVDPIS